MPSSNPSAAKDAVTSASSIRICFADAETVTFSLPEDPETLLAEGKKLLDDLLKQGKSIDAATFHLRVNGLALLDGSIEKDAGQTLQMRCVAGLFIGCATEVVPPEYPADFAEPGNYLKITPEEGTPTIHDLKSQTIAEADEEVRAIFKSMAPSPSDASFLNFTSASGQGAIRFIVRPDLDGCGLTMRVDSRCPLSELPDTGPLTLFKKSTHDR